MNILVIDDERITHRMISMILKRGGHETMTAESVPAALEILRTMPVDLVTCDLMMPGQSGLDFLRIVKADPALAALPVIIISAAGHATELDQAIDLGAAAVVNKPFTTRELEAVVTAHLPKKAHDD